MSFTRILLFLCVLAVVLVFVIPSLWPEPSVEIMTPRSAVRGEDMRFTLRIRTWHENFRIRLVRVTINDMASTALSGKSPLLPLTLLRDDMAHTWNVGILKRVTFPRALSLELLVPFKELHRQGKIGAGIVRGNVFVEIDHTRTRFDGTYPSLVFKANLPFEVAIVD